MSLNQQQLRVEHSSRSRANPRGHGGRVGSRWGLEGREGGGGGSEYQETSCSGRRDGGRRRPMVGRRRVLENPGGWGLREGISGDEGGREQGASGSCRLAEAAGMRGSPFRR